MSKIILLKGITKKKIFFFILFSVFSIILYYAYAPTRNLIWLDLDDTGNGTDLQCYILNTKDNKIVTAIVLFDYKRYKIKIIGGAGYMPTEKIILSISEQYFEIDSHFFYSSSDRRNELTQFVFYYKEGDFFKIRLTEELYASIVSDHSSLGIGDLAKKLRERAREEIGVKIE